MIEIKITKGNCRYKISAVGHAGHGKAGEDIVCAGVSSLFYALNAGLEDIRHTGMFNEKNANVWKEFKWNVSDSVWVQKVIKSIEKGLFWIADQYPNNLRVEVENMNECSNHEKVKEIAEKLNGIAYGENIRDIEAEAKEHGIVIVMGASDDLMEFSGAIEDEGGCYDGGEVYFDRDGVSQDDTERANVIVSVWCGKTADGQEASWVYETDIPHEKFYVYEDEEVYCEGIVFSVEDLK